MYSQSRTQTRLRRTKSILFAALLVGMASAILLFDRAQPVQAAGTEVKVTTNGQFGDILTDASGRTLYLFKNDRRLESNCSGGCLTAWPPLLTEETPVAGDGVDQSRLGTITRADGTVQVAFNGWPLYYWQDDVEEGDTDGQDRGDVWFVVSPFGGPVHTSAKIELNEDLQFGDIITDESGRVLYLWKRDEKDTSHCNGRCALNWPPLLTADDPASSEGLPADRLGTITRDDGSTQATYNGWPLYYWFLDSEPGDALGQEVGRTWYVLSSHGAAIHSVAPLNLGENEEFGTILTDRSGRTLYLFDRDAPGVSNCAGGCALNWPPFLTSRDPIDIGGVDTGLLGTTERADGYRQVTYNGWPLYYWVNDVTPGDTSGQTVGDVWWVLDANGNKIDAPTTSTTAERDIAADTGGSVRSRDGQVSVTIDSGDLATDGTVTLQPVSTPAPTAGLNGVRIASDAVDLSFSDTAGEPVAGRLHSPVEVCMSFNDEDGRGSVSGTLGLRVLQFNESGNYWVTLTTRVNFVSGVVCGQTSVQGSLALGQSTR